MHFAVWAELGGAADALIMKIIHVSTGRRARHAHGISLPNVSAAARHRPPCVALDGRAAWENSVCSGRSGKTSLALTS